MAKKNTAMQKSFVKEDGTTVLKCPFCRHARTVSIARFRGKKKIITVKCTCRESYSVWLEYRKMYRKNISLPGRYINLTLDNEAGLMTVTDISMAGIGFETAEKCNMEIDHELEVTFTLDDTHSSVIKKMVVVKIIRRGRFIGCEFMHAHEYDKALGFYLLP